MTVGTIRKVVGENLKRAGVTTLPNASELLGIVNRAKDEVVQRMEIMDESGLFTTRATFSVAQGDPSITLPTDFRRLIQLRRTDSGRDEKIEVYETRTRDDAGGNTINWPMAGLGSAAVYEEGGKLWFVQTAGAPEAMTMRLHYRNRVADATETAASLNAEYSGFPGEWADLIAQCATAMALPAANPEYGRYMARYNDGLALMKQAINERVLDGPKRVRLKSWPWSR